MPLSVAGSIGYAAAPLLALFQTRHSGSLTPSSSSPSLLSSAADDVDLEKASLRLLSASSFSSSSSLRWRLRSLCRCLPYRLHDWDSTPDFLRTPYILTSYRVLFPFSLALRSFLLLHNETVNVWTHSAGAVYVLYLMQSTYGLTLPAASASLADYLLLAVFHLSALLCFLCSALYHWFGCMSVSAHSCLYIGDMSAIGLLILGSYIPGLYYGFYCRPLFQLLYIAAIVGLVSLYFALYQFRQCHAHRQRATVVSAVSAVSASSAAVVIPHVASSSARQHAHWLRVLLLVSIVMFAVVPALHFTLIVGSDYPGLPLWRVLMPLLQMLGLYALGFGFYVSHWPERRWPRRFDIWLSSHQLWHVLIVLAVSVWHHNLMQVFQLRSIAVCLQPLQPLTAQASPLHP